MSQQAMKKKSFNLSARAFALKIPLENVRRLS